MKKLMIAAAAAAMIGGAYADLCTDTTDPTGCAVYDVKFTLKSLGPKLLKIKGSSNTCGDTAAECCTYFDSATYTFNGIIWDCEASCDTLSKDSDSVKYVMWSTKAKMPVTAQLEMTRRTRSGLRLRLSSPFLIVMARRVTRFRPSSAFMIS